MLDQIPLHRPSTPLLDSVSTPAQLRNLSKQQLPQLAEELRSFLLYSVGQTGGHFGAGLGVVELTIALHYLLDTPRDKLVWDVGHQTYPHKILTGRREQMHTIRQLGGLSGFPLRSESEYDCFGVGHSSTSISAALGMALATAKDQPPHQCVAVIGDGAMTAGMAFEALNHAAHTGADLLVVLNDNDMSISHNIGGLAKPHRVSDKGLPAGNLFRDMGFDYTGPVDGHRFDDLLSHLRTVLLRRGPRLLHICTQKGKGFGPAERDPVGYHALTKIEPRQVQATAETKPPGKKYQQVFGEWLSAVAERDPKLVAITPAMSEGSGMVDFANTYPARFHDVGIAEQHAVTLAAGLACEAMKPVVAIYSTFLQRAYDQLIHDVCLQNLDVLFAIDRAGLVGEDGPSHAGSFDISFLRCIPNMVIAVPGDENECYQLLTAAYNHPGPAAVRYPRGKGPGAEIHKNSAPARVGKGVLRRSGEALCILNFGAPLADALAIAEKNNYTLCDMRWAKPLDTELILEQSSTHRYLVTLEENALAGGAGSAVAELLAERGTRIQLLRLGLPDRFIEQGKRARLLHEAGLSRDLMERRIQHFIQQGAAPARAGK